MVVCSRKKQTCKLSDCTFWRKRAAEPAAFVSGGCPFLLLLLLLYDTVVPCVLLCSFLTLGLADSFPPAVLAVQSVIIVPGYGLAVARAQQAVAELTSMLTEQGIKVKQSNKTRLLLLLLPSCRRGYCTVLYCAVM